jgi:hypothetical protein
VRNATEFDLALLIAQLPVPSTSEFGVGAASRSVMSMVT